MRKGLGSSLAGLHYETVAAAQTDQVLGSADASTGRGNEFLSHLILIPANTSPGAVSIKDGATSITVFTGGASSLTELRPIVIELQLTGKPQLTWKVTTGADIAVIAIGLFK